MTKKLKTLKDLLIDEMEETTQGAAFYTKGKNVGVSIQDLTDEEKDDAIYFQLRSNKSRQEAIKWIKELIDDKPTNISPMRMVGKNRLQQLEFTINWIKHFFNIGEDDLK